MRKTIKASITLIGLLLTCTFSIGQDQRTEFMKSLHSGDTVKQKEILTKWEKSDPTNAELYTCYYNYYFAKSKQEFISITNEKQKGQSMSFVDSTGQVAGYMGSEITFDPAIMENAFNWLDEGIKRYPDRLDMRFGKIYGLGELEEWERFTNEIVKAIQYSQQNKNQWTWTNNEKKEDGENIFLTSLQDYQVQLYNAGKKEQLLNMRSIANEVLKYYPDHIESLSNLSLTYLLNEEYDRAIDILLRAEKLNPKDGIVIANIAQGYKLKGDKQNAIAYYEKMIKYGDKEMAEYARGEIKKLKK